MGENQFDPVPTALYGSALLLSAVAWYIMQAVIIRQQGPDSPLRRAIGADLKGKLSPAAYIAAIALSFVNRWIACALYVLIAVVWLIPDPRIERALADREHGGA